MQIQDQPVFVPNHKTFNMFTSTIIKNFIPSMLEMFKLQTHHDLILNNSLHRYVTNIILASSRWLKLYVMFQKNQIYDIFETEVQQTVRSLHQIQKTLLLEVDHKLICLSYQPGNLKTVAMVSLEFIRLRYGYRSMIRVDNFKKYMFMIAGDYLILALSPKSKQTGRLIQCPLFQKALDEVKWAHHDHNYFQSILFLKITKSFFKSIVDVQFDKSHIYFLSLENSVASIYTLTFDDIKPDSTIDSLFVLKFTNLPAPCYKLSVLNPQVNSSFLIFSSTHIFHLTLWQETPVSKYQLAQNTDISTLKARPFNPSNVYYHDSNGINVLKILNSGQMENSRVSDTSISDFCMTTVSVNGCLAYFSNGNCIVETFQGKVCIHSWINSLIDFHIGKNTILALEYQDPIYKNGKESNKVISIKKNFKWVDKMSSNPKKSFVESVFPAEIQSLGSTKHFLAKIGNTKTLFKDSDNISMINTQAIQRAFEVKIKGESFLGVYYQNSSLYLYEINNFTSVWNAQNIIGNVIDTKGGLFLIENQGILTLIDFEKKQVMRLKHNLKNQTIKCYVSKQNISFVKRTFNDHVEQDARYLLYACTPDALEIYVLKPLSDSLILVWNTLKIGSGLALLTNNLQKHRSTKQLDEYRSISDPHYVISNLISQTNEQQSKYKVIDFNYCQLPSQTVLVFLTSNNQFYLYKRIIDENIVGIVYKRVILPLHEPKINELTLCQYTPEILRFGSRVLYDDVIMEIIEPIRQCFNLGGEVWLVGNDNKLRLCDLKGNNVSGKIVQTIAENNSYHGIDSTPEYYILFTRDSIQLYDKDLNFRSKIAVKVSSSQSVSSQIITAKAFQNLCAVSSCEYFKSVTEDFESYKFVFFIYDIKEKLRSDALKFDQPVVSIKFGKPGRIAFATSSNFYVYQIRQGKLQVVKTVFYSLRNYLGGFSYWRDTRPNASNSPHFMVFGGAHEGLSFAGFDDQKLIFQQKWFEPLHFGTRDVQIFLFGTSFKALIADNNKNIVVMDLSNQSTSKLFDFHLDTLVNKLTKADDTGRPSELVYCCCADGTIRVFTAIKRQEDVSLRKFQKLILEQLPSFGGLALERRLRQQNRSYKVNCKGNIVESGTLQIFNSVSQEIRESIIQKSQYESEEEIQSIISKNCIF